MQRYLSFTFDDGLFTGASKARRLLENYGLRACFYLVTGWVEPTSRRIRDPLNVGRKHGTWDDWREFDRAGHEIGSHTESHLDATSLVARYLPWRLRREFERSSDELHRQLGKRPASVAMPYAVATRRSDVIARQVYRTCRLSSGRPCYNDLVQLNWCRLASWGPGSTVLASAICRSIDEIPDGRWLILNFHSLDDEGWMPISAAAFKELLQFVSRQPSLRVVTPGEMADEFGQKAAIAACSSVARAV
jgi:peptidoglycan/xylan/chitin deacetylase (PgdA/CDA1 family)